MFNINELLFCNVNLYFIENIKMLNIIIVSVEKILKFIFCFVYSLMVLVMKCKYFIIYCFILSSYVIYVNVKVGIRLILYFMFLIEKNINVVVVIIKRIIMII